MHETEHDLHGVGIHVFRFRAARSHLLVEVVTRVARGRVDVRALAERIPVTDRAGHTGGADVGVVDEFGVAIAEGKEHVAAKSGNIGAGDYAVTLHHAIVDRAVVGKTARDRKGTAGHREHAALFNREAADRAEARGRSAVLDRQNGFVDVFVVRTERDTALSSRHSASTHGVVGERERAAAVLHQGDAAAERLLEGAVFIDVNRERRLGAVVCGADRSIGAAERSEVRGRHRRAVGERKRA